MSSRESPIWSHAVATIVTASLIAGLWLYTESSGSYLVAPLGDVLVRFREVWFFEHFDSDLLPSLIRLASGFLIACLAGVSFGVPLGLSPLLRALAEPSMGFLRAVPPIVLIPPAIVLLGIGNTMRITIIAFVCVWPVLLNAADGIAELDSTMLASARAYGLGGLDRLRFVILPAAAPRIAAGMRTALGLAMLVLIVTELIASTNGIGTFLLRAQQTYQIEDMWTAVILLGLLGILLNYAFGRIEQRVLRWHFKGGSR